MRNEQITIIGAGPAGISAAVQCHRLGFTPRLLDKTGRAGGLVWNAYCVENYPGLIEPLSGPLFADSLRAHLGRFGLKIEKLEIQKIVSDPNGFTLLCDGSELHSKAVIVACGTRHLPLGIPHERELVGEYVFYEVRSLLEKHPRPKTVMVVGGGEASLDSALTLALTGALVHLIVRKNELKAQGKLVRAVLDSSLVHVQYRTSCRSLELEETCRARLVGEVEEDLTSIDVDVILIAVGRTSAAISLLDGFDATMPDFAGGEIHGLYVVGDARRGSLGQIGIAVGDGIAAAMSAVNFLTET